MILHLMHVGDYLAAAGIGLIAIPGLLEREWIQRHDRFSRSLWLVGTSTTVLGIVSHWL